jgi:FMN-dependent NADH-azoreductase
MSRILHVETSPRKQRSASIQVARAFIDRYVELHPNTTVDRLDVWDLQIPEFDGHAMEAKYAGLAGVELTDAQRQAWQRINELAQPFRDADLFVFSVPLWNFGIPYKLKHLIDAISQKDVLFTFNSDEGLRGMLHGKKAVMAYARGVTLSDDSDTPARLFDFQQDYMNLWLNMVGVTDIESIVVEKTLFGPEVDADSREEAVRQAIALASRIQDRT